MGVFENVRATIDVNINANGEQRITGKVLNGVLQEIVSASESSSSDLQESLSSLSEKVDNIGSKDFNPSGTYPDLTAGDLAGRGESVPASFGFRASGGKSIKDGRAYIKRIKGNSVVWNNYFNIEKISVNGGTMSRDGNKIVVTATGEYPRIVGYTATLGTLPKGHVVLITFNADKELRINFPSSAILGQGYANGYEWQLFVVDEYDYFTIYHDTESYTVGNIRITDLTRMFQAGNEPTTIEEFNARVATLGVDMYAYNEGEVIHCNTESIKSVGDNAWDEEWRLGFFVSGQYIDSPTQICSKNPIKVLPNESYYINQDQYYVWYYDREMRYIDYAVRFNKETFVTPSNAAYIHFNLEPPYGTTYKNDIIVTLVHSGWKQDTDAGYQPYWQDTLPLPIIRKYFPDGMRLAGTAHDEIRFNKASGKWEAVQRIGSVDLGTLGWYYTADFGGYYSDMLYTANTDFGGICSAYPFVGKYINVNDKEMGVIFGQSILIKDSAYTDAAAFKASLQGVMLYYELAEPIVTEITEDFRDYYQVADFGTEEAIPATDAEGNIIPSAAFSADIIYQFNAVDMIREHELEINELQDAIKAMQAQLASFTNL